MKTPFKHWTAYRDSLYSKSYLEQEQEDQLAMAFFAGMLATFNAATESLDSADNMVAYYDEIKDAALDVVNRAKAEALIEEIERKSALGEIQ